MAGEYSFYENDNFETALKQAQMLVYDAWEENTAAKRRALAKKALKLSPLCADAWSILAELAPMGSDEEIDLCRRAFQAGKDALGPGGFKNAAGHFWGLLETRPYMRARAALAQALWERGERDEAIAHLKALLRLNPGDNQGNRYVLAGWLATASRNEELGKLLRKHRHDGAPFFVWTAVLQSFRLDGGGEATRKLMERAMAGNPYVPQCLNPYFAPRKRAPDYYTVGEISEAQIYARDFGEAWKATPDALRWVWEQKLTAGTKLFGAP